MTPRRRFEQNTSSLSVYLREIGHFDPLSKSEEMALARAGDDKALQELVKHNLKYVVKVAGRYKGMGLSFADLINEGNVGMIMAAQRYREDKGVKFITYAVWWIRQSIIKALADQAKVVRLPVKQAGLLLKVSRCIDKMRQKLSREPAMDELAHEMEIKLSTLETIMRVYRGYMSLDSPLKDEDNSTLFIDMLESESGNCIEEDFIRLCLHHDIEKLLKTLTKREEVIIRMRFGFDQPPATLERIGKRVGLTRERIRQIEKLAKEKLRSKTGIKILEDYLR
ncbi:MAG TPA: RNA polymerase sigma factor RpoD/SigA [Nitrospirae bacterium]|nr:RNA polymerase sigma factor RpoD/SigA [Nitrospirota bacterium]